MTRRDTEMKNKIIRSFILYTMASCISCPAISAEEYDISGELFPEEETVIYEESYEILPEEESVIYEDAAPVDEIIADTQEEYVELYEEAAVDYEEMIFEDSADCGNEDYSWDDYLGEENDSESEGETSLYAGEVLRYLILPKGTSVPEGIEEDMIPLTFPIESIYPSEKGVQENLKAAGYSGEVITSTGEKAETASSSDQGKTFPGSDSSKGENRKK